METPTPEELLAQFNAMIAACGLKYVLVDEPTPDTSWLKPWFLNEETHLYKKSDFDIPVVLTLLESEPVQKS